MRGLIKNKPKILINDFFYAPYVPLYVTTTLSIKDLLTRPPIARDIFKDE